MDRQLVRTDTKTRTRAQIFAFIIALAALLIGGFLIYDGKSIAGIGTLLLGLGPIIGAFVVGRNQPPDQATGEEMDRP